MKAIVTVNFDDIRLSGYETDYVIQTIKQKNNFYEIETLSKWFPYFKDAEYIFDVGANLGNHSVFFAKKCKNSHIFSFEPFPDNYELLTKNIDENELANVTPCNKAVGKHVGYVKVNEFDESNYGGTSFKESDGSEDSLQMTSIDNAILDLSLSKLDFVKIDTEGFELEVIQGMSYVIENYHPIVWVECSETSIKDVYRILKKAGYGLFDIEGANALFIHGTTESIIDIDDILVQRFRYLDKTNTYYANYLKSKEWLSERNDAYTKLNDSFSNVKRNLECQKEKYEALNEEYCNSKRKLEEQNEKYNALNEAHIKCQKLLIDTEKRNQESENKLREINVEYLEIKKTLADKTELADKYRNKLKDATVLVYDNEEALLDARHQIENLQNKVKAISTQLAEDERKLGIIHSHWYWRIGLNFYLWLKKMKHKLAK